MTTYEDEIDPKKLFERADKVLNQLATLCAAIVDSATRYHLDPTVKLEMGNSVALIMSLRKTVDEPKEPL